MSLRHIPLALSVSFWYTSVYHALLLIIYFYTLGRDAFPISHSNFMRIHLPRSRKRMRRISSCMVAHAFRQSLYVDRHF